AGADADGAIGAGLRAAIDRRCVRIVGYAVIAEQVVQETARSLLLLLLQGSRILRSAVVLREREQHRAALVFALAAANAAGTQAFEILGDLLEVCPHLLHLIVHRTALRVLAVEQRKETGAFAAHSPRLKGNSIKLGLLLGGRILIAADLLLAGGVAAATIDHGQLRFQPRTHRVD